MKFSKRPWGKRGAALLGWGEGVIPQPFGGLGQHPVCPPPPHSPVTTASTVTLETPYPHSLSFYLLLFMIAGYSPWAAAILSAPPPPPFTSTLIPIQAPSINLGAGQ